MDNKNINLNKQLLYIKYLNSVNLIMPYLDFIYTFCWIPGLILAFWGIYWIVGPMTLLVLPLTFISRYRLVFLISCISNSFTFNFLSYIV